MISFESDYIAGAHEKVLQKLIETNLEPLSGYGSDKYTRSACEKIKEACECEDADVYLLTGGTQTNALIISTMLADYEGVIAADTGHVGCHEAGAIEYTGHKVLPLPNHQGKLDAGEVEQYLKTFYADGNHEHMVFPGMVYISHPTEYGTLYSKEELTELAKGRLLGVQFDTLFTDNLYFDISKHAIKMAVKLKEVLKDADCTFFMDSPTNQQFIVMEDSKLEQFGKVVAYSFWEKYDEYHTVIRLATSWSTKEEDLETLRKVLEKKNG